MKNNHQVEVILFSNYCFNDMRKKELVRWLGTTAQSTIIINIKKKEIISEKTEGYTWNLHVMKMKTVVRNNSSLEMAAL